MHLHIRQVGLPAEGRRLALALACVLHAACATAPVPLQPPVGADASRALAEAMDLWRDGHPGALEEALAAAHTANRLAPDWVAPQRFVDDRLREELLGPNALERHREALVSDPDDAVHLYLAGRLEGPRGIARLRHAAAQEPGLSWAQHGLGWNAFMDGRMAEAIGRGEGALARSRDAFERANFSSMLARYLSASSEHELAVRVLEERLADPELSSRYRAWIACELAGTELGADERGVRRRGVRRALDLIAASPLSEAELEGLVRSLHLPRRAISITVADVDLALAERATNEALAVAQSPLPGSTLELDLWHGPAAPRAVSARSLRLARFSYGDPCEAVEAWLVQLPKQVLDGSGLPRNPRLRRIVEAERALGDVALGSADPAAVVELGDALIAAGWFPEAQAFAARVPGGDHEYALDLRTRGLAGRATLDAVAALLRGLPQKRPRFPALVDDPPDGEPSGLPSDDRGTPRIRNLDDLLVGLSGIFQRAHVFLGGELDLGAVREELLLTPRVDYGWVGAVLHPGRFFSEQDERLGRGAAGEPVPGLSEELHRLGRFAVIGDMAGSRAPDGTVLELVLLEQRSGEHLGIAWSGSVAWCERGDFHGGASRNGVAIGGAALHEGYFVDLAVVRGEFQRWRALADRFTQPDGPQRVSRALAVRGVPMAPGESWTATDLLLGEADRMRLAVMADRAQAGGLGTVAFDEFVELTAVHEEGHLCDRARLYPVSEHFSAVLSFLFSAGFTPTGAERVLEYRAQLVALCDIPDPRLAWAEILQAAESGGAVTAHAAAYTRLLRDLLRELQASWKRDPLAWRELDPDRLLVHQVHHLAPEKLRELALGLARKRGYDPPPEG